MMIFVRLENHSYFYELSDIIKMYFGKVEIALMDEKASDNIQDLPNDSILLISVIESEGCNVTCKSEYYSQGVLQQKAVESQEESKSFEEKEIKRLVKTTMYKLLADVFKKEFPWGILTGIRPVKLVHEMLDQEQTDSTIRQQLKKKFLVSEDRIKLAIDIAKAERQFIYPVRTKEMSVYVGIPFCPSRCYYCSFTSNDIKKYQALVEPYLQGLEKEIKAVSKYLKDNHVSIQTVYLGGGTPTALNPAQLERLVHIMNESFGNGFSEFSCEAGRPDSITREKLEALKGGNVTRISINPQTMNDDTLLRIGRAHNTRQIIESFMLARQMGFDNINMDLILGLPGEGEKELDNTLNALKLLNPESVTVHTMAIKRASIINEKPDQYASANDEEAAAMMEKTKAFLSEMRLYPYYLYRQKHMLQNLENVGYSKKGCECIYNIQIIEEKQSIVAFGADAVTKAVFHKENRIERQHNIKDVRLYIENIGKQIGSKLKLLEELLNCY